MHTINWITNYSKNTLWRSRSFILTLFQVLTVGYVIKYCVWWWCFILTLNRASALSGSKYEQNYLLLSESRCSRRKNRFRVKTNEGLFFSPPWGCFILTLNRASALSGSRYELNFLLLYKPRCNEIKNRFRVKTNEGFSFVRIEARTKLLVAIQLSLQLNKESV